MCKASNSRGPGVCGVEYRSTWLEGGRRASGGGKGLDHTTTWGVVWSHGCVFKRVNGYNWHFKKFLLASSEGEVMSGAGCMQQKPSEKAVLDRRW